MPNRTWDSIIKVTDLKALRLYRAKSCRALNGDNLDDFVINLNGILQAGGELIKGYFLKKTPVETGVVPKITACL